MIEWLGETAKLFWLPGCVGAAMGLAGYWEKVLPQLDRTESRVQLLLEIAFARRCTAIRGLMDAVTRRTELLTGGGSSNEAYADYIRTEDQFVQHSVQARRVEREIGWLRGTCVSCGWSSGVLTVAGFLLRSVAHAQALVLVVVVAVAIAAALAMWLCQKAVGRLREIELNPLFIGGRPVD